MMFYLNAGDDNDDV